MVIDEQNWIPEFWDYFNHIIVNHNKKDDVKILNISQFTLKINKIQNHSNKVLKNIISKTISSLKPWDNII